MPTWVLSPRKTFPDKSSEARPLLICKSSNALTHFLSSGSTVLVANTKSLPMLFHSAVWPSRISWSIKIWAKGGQHRTLS